MKYSVYKYLDYRALIKGGIGDLKARYGKSISYKNLADYCHVQKTYLSKVLNHHGNLTQDQLFLACEYLQLGQEQADYTLLLHSFEGTKISKRKEKLRQEIGSRQRMAKKSEIHMETNIVQTNDIRLTAYFLNPDLQLVHLFLTIKKYRKNLGLIEATLGLSSELLGEYLKILEDMNLIRLVRKEYKALDHNLHLPQGSSVFPAYRTMMKLKGLEKLKHTQEDMYSLGVFLSCSSETKEYIHNQFLAFLSDIKKRVDLDKPEEVYQLGFDLLKWS